MKHLIKLTFSLAVLLFIANASWAQQRTLSGTVVDQDGISLPGVTVIEKGTTNGAVTNIDGNFSVTVSENAEILQFSFVGMKAKEVLLGSSATYNVTLEQETIGLDEVVAIGYGTVKKSDLTGSVSSMNSEMLTEMNKTDVGQAMQGRMAGVDVRKLNSKPGAPMSIKIRGNTVIKNNNVGKDGVSDAPTADLGQPLYVVDGIFLDDINIINPADIEKMDILKDASATAIYGSRGANGVVIITTKTGIEGKTQFTYSGSVGVNQAVNVSDMYNGGEYVEFIDDFLRGKQWRAAWADGNATVDDYNNLPVDVTSEFVGSNEQANVANKRYTDWVDMFTHTGIQTNHSLGMSGGQNGLVYNASVGYTKDEGVMGIEAYERYNVSASVSKKVKNYLTVGVQTYFSYSDREEGSKELFRSVRRLAPTVNPYEEDGTIRLIPDEQDQRFLNPIYEDQGAALYNTRKMSFISNIFAEIKPVEWFSFKTNFAPQINSSRFGEFRGLYTKSARNDPSRMRAYYNTAFTNSYTWDNIANFDFDVAEGHNLKTTLISSFWYQQDEGSKIETRNFDTDSYLFYNTAGANDSPRSYNSFYSKETLAAYAIRLNYNIKEKYLFTFTGRYDGSSKLAKGHKWSFFPSAAFAWRMSEEDFMQDIDWLSNLKLRLSYGESGNDAVVSRYASQAYLSNTSYLFGNNIASGNAVRELANAELGWEVSKEYNIGFDLGLFNNRISLDAEFYNKKTEDAIFDKQLFALTGFSSATGNFGSVRNKGFELALNTVNIDKGDFTWRTSINFAKNINEIIKIEGDLDKIPYGRHGVLQIGQPIDAMYAYDKIGIWQMDEAADAAVYNAVPGMYKYVDQNNDDVIDQDDKVVIGSHSPDWTGGMTNNLTYKNFNFSVMIYTRQGVLGHSEFYQHFSPITNEGKFNKIDIDYWTPNNQNGEYSIPFAGNPGEWHYEDMSFVKVGNIGLGYDMPKSVLDALSISNLHLSLDIQNPFTFTNYKGPDPETGLQNSWGMANSIRTILFGVKLKF